MKKRYLFPLLYLGLGLLGLFLIPFVFHIAWILSMPAIQILNPVSVSLGRPVDITFLVILATCFQFFLVGYLWDVIALRIKSDFLEKQNKKKVREKHD